MVTSWSTASIVMYWISITSQIKYLMSLDQYALYNSCLWSNTYQPLILKQNDKEELSSFNRRTFPIYRSLGTVHMHNVHLQSMVYILFRNVGRVDCNLLHVLCVAWVGRNWRDGVTLSELCYWDNNSNSVVIWGSLRSPAHITSLLTIYNSSIINN